MGLATGVAVWARKKTKIPKILEESQEILEESQESFKQGDYQQVLNNYKFCKKSKPPIPISNKQWAILGEQFLLINDLTNTLECYLNGFGEIDSDKWMALGDLFKTAANLAIDLEGSASNTYKCIRCYYKANCINDGNVVHNEKLITIMKKLNQASQSNFQFRALDDSETDLANLIRYYNEPKTLMELAPNVALKLIKAVELSNLNHGNLDAVLVSYKDSFQKQVSSVSSEQWIQLGEKYLSKNDLIHTLECYQKANVGGKMNPQKWMEIGNAFFANKDKYQALKCYYEAHCIDRSNVLNNKKLLEILTTPNSFDEFYAKALKDGDEELVQIINLSQTDGALKTQFPTEPARLIQAIVVKKGNSGRFNLTNIAKVGMVSGLLYGGAKALNYIFQRIDFPSIMTNHVVNNLSPTASLGPSLSNLLPSANTIGYLALGVIGALGIRQAGKKMFRPLLQQAADHYEKEEYEKTLKIYVDANKLLIPVSSDKWLQLGNGFIVKGDRYHALRCYHKAFLLAESSLASREHKNDLDEESNLDEEDNLAIQKYQEMMQTLTDNEQRAFSALAQTEEDTELETMLKKPTFKDTSFIASAETFLFNGFPIEALNQYLKANARGIAVSASAWIRLAERFAENGDLFNTIRCFFRANDNRYSREDAEVSSLMKNQEAARQRLDKLLDGLHITTLTDCFSKCNKDEEQLKALIKTATRQRSVKLLDDLDITS